MKESMKRLLCTLLAACLLCGAAVTASIAGAETGSSSTCGDGVTWQFDEETGVLTIQGSGPMYDFEDEMNLPWSQYLKQIKKVMVVYGVTSIGKNAFAGCTVLEEISLPETVTAIGTGAFRDCESLQEVDLSATALASLKADTFTGCAALTTVKLPASIQSIDPAAFHGAQNLREIVCIGEEAQINQLLKDIDLGNTEIIIISTEDTGDETAKEEEPAPIPTQPQPTEPAPTAPLPTQPAEPVETKTVRYEGDYEITETWLDGKLIFRRDVYLGNAIWLRGPRERAVEYSDFNDFGQPQKKVEYLMNYDYYNPELEVTCVSTLRYDEEGVLIEEFGSSSDGENIYEATIENGVKVQDNYTDQSVVTYEYDDNGKLIKETRRNGDSDRWDELNIRYEYDECGELIRKVVDDRLDKKEYSFENGKLSACDWEVYGKYEFEWNEQGQLVKCHGKDFTGRESETTYQYDEQGYLVEEICFFPEYQSATTTKYDYENGELISKIVYNGSKVTHYFEIKDENVTFEKVALGNIKGIYVSDGTEGFSLTYDLNGEIIGLSYSKNDNGKYYYQYDYSLDAASGEWEITRYYGSGNYKTEKGSEPQPDDSLLQYILSLDPTIIEVMKAMALEAEPIYPEAETPEGTEPAVTEPVTTEPEVTEPETTEPETDKYEVIEAEATKPEVTKPEVTEPEATEPKITEYEVAEPKVIVSGTAEPVVTPPAEAAAA